MSSCLSGGGRTYGFDLDIVKSSSLSSSSSGRSSHTSSPSSTLSESSNSPGRTISIKKARAPRKRPNQTYNEAAALLSTIYPNIFPTNSPKKLPTKAKPFSSCFPESPDLLPPFPVLSDTGFLIRESSLPEKPAFSFQFRPPTSPVEKSCTSPASSESREPESPRPLDDDFDAESILDEEVEEGIDSIIGNLSMITTSSADSTEELNTYTSHINPYLRTLIGLGTGGKFELGLGFRFGRTNMQRALRQRDDGDWWRSPAVPVGDIVAKFQPSAAPSLEKKKKKKKVEKVEVLEDKQTDATATAAAIAADTATTTTPEKTVKASTASLGLKLNHEDVIKAWSGRGSMFTDGPDSPNSSAEALAKLSDIDLFLDAAGTGGLREASVLRYKEKKRNRLFSKKIRYQVRKVNADRRPRMKGRFVRRPSLLRHATEEESE